MKNIRLAILFAVTILLVSFGLVSAASEIVISKDKSEYGGYVLRNIEIEGDVLKLSVSDLGGCWTGNFDFIWDGDYLKSIPPQVNLHLNINEYNDRCKALISKDLEFDLKKLRLDGEKSIRINFLYIKYKGLAFLGANPLCYYSGNTRDINKREQ